MNKEVVNKKPIDELMKKGVTLHNVHIMSELNGLVLTVKDDEDSGAKVTYVLSGLKLTVRLFKCRSRKERVNCGT